MTMDFEKFEMPPTGTLGIAQNARNEIFLVHMGTTDRKGRPSPERRAVPVQGRNIVVMKRGVEIQKSIDGTGSVRWTDKYRGSTYDWEWLTENNNLLT